MGCDGGSIPKRGEVVRTKKAAEKPDKASQQVQRWFFCALSKRPLQRPVVACGLGKLYNKDAVYEFLLDPTSHGDGDQICPHIKKPKDVITLNLAENTAASTTNLQTSALETNASAMESSLQCQFMCPITMKEMNGHQRFCFLWTCGCVFSEQALREVPSQGKCLQCNKPYTENDVYPVNPKPEELPRLQERLLQRRELDKAAKKNNKKKLHVVEVKVRDGTAVSSGGKRKADQETASTTAAPAKKPHHPASGSATPSTSTTPTSAVPKILLAKQTSAAIQSIYKSSQKQDGSKESWLTKGTFNRYVA